MLTNTSFMKVIKGNELVFNDYNFYLYFFLTYSGVGPHDIALMHLATPLKFNDVVKPVKLPQRDEEFTGEARLSGWGVTVNAREPVSAQILQSARIPLISFNGNIIN